MFARVAAAAALALGGFAVASGVPAYADGFVGTFRAVFNGAQWTYNGGVVPRPDTSATYTFTSSCPGPYCFATGTLVPPTDDSMSGRMPNLSLGSPGGGTWQLTAPVDSPCPEGITRKQTVEWILHAQGDQYNFTVLTGTRTVTTLNSCKGDAAGIVTQPITVIRVN